ncbi:hypothetical protein CR513_17811, partial [Mucuna pruriens]
MKLRGLLKGVLILILVDSQSGVQTKSTRLDEVTPARRIFSKPTPSRPDADSRCRLPSVRMHPAIKDRFHSGNFEHDLIRAKSEKAQSDVDKTPPDCSILTNGDVRKCHVSHYLISALRITEERATIQTQRPRKITLKIDYSNKLNQRDGRRPSGKIRHALNTPLEGYKKPHREELGAKNH